MAVQHEGRDVLLSLKRHESLIRTLGATTLVGITLGAFVGGIGFRLAMRALFLTSGPSVRGVVSDDGFRIGVVTSATANLIFLGTLFGIVGAVVYLGVRPFLIGPRWLRALTCGLAGGAVIGSQLVHPEGVDFTLLSPTWLAIALVVAVPALFGVLTSLVVEWILRVDGWAQTARLRWVAPPLLVFLFPPLLLLVGPPVVVVLGTRYVLDRSPTLRRPAFRQPTMWLIRAVWLAIAALGLVGLVQDVVVIL